MKRFLANWELKVLAILAALVFWFLVVGTENTFYTFPEEIPIKAFNIAEDLVVAEDLGTVTLRLKIEKRESVKNLVVDDFNAYVDLEGLGEGEREVDVEVSSKKPEATVLKIEPGLVTVKIEQKSEKEVPIEYELRGNVSEGYEVKDISIIEENVIVKGSGNVLADIETATLIIELNGEDKDIKKNFPLQILNNEGEETKNVTLEKQEIEAEVKIALKSGQKMVGIQPNITGTPKDNVWIKSINIEPSFVLISGDQETLNSIEYVKTEEINVEDLSENKDFTVTVSGLPEEVSIEGDNQVNVSIEVESYESEGITKIRTVNVPVLIKDYDSDQYDRTVNPPYVTLLIEGTDDDFDKIPSDLQLEIDISNKEGSKAVFEVSETDFSLDEELTITKVMPSEVTAKWK